MKKYAINIKFIPKNIKYKVTERSLNKLKFVGYKQITHNCVIPLIQLPNKKRIWLLKQEIIYKI